MNWASFKEAVREYGYVIGIDKMGFTDVRPLSEHLPRLIARQKSAYKFAINEGDPEKRVSPALHLPEAKSIISVAVAYPGQDMQEQSGDISARGRISLIARGPDYHTVVRDKLARLAGFIKSEVPEAKTVSFTDTGEILEKAIAVKAGLGWIGRNTLLITPEFGSWVSLGELLTNLPLPPDEPFEGGCGTCRRCIEACPTGALDEDRNLNLDRCLAGITLTKTLPPKEIRPAMDNLLYGCDYCQLVCPHNKKTQETGRPDYCRNYEDSFPTLDEVLNLTNSEFKRRFGHTSAAWRGRTPMQRNAVIAAGNLRDTAAVPALTAILFSDPRPVLRGAAAWALGQIGGEKSSKALQMVSATEQDPVVQAEIVLALQKQNGGNGENKKGLPV